MGWGGGGGAAAVHKALYRYTLSRLKRGEELPPERAVAPVPCLKGETPVGRPRRCSVSSAAVQAMLLDSVLRNGRKRLGWCD